MRKLWLKGIALALLVTLMTSVFLAPVSAAEPTVKKGYTVLKTAKTDQDGVYVYEGEKMSFKKGQSIFFLADFVDAAGEMNLTNEGVVQAIGLSDGKNEFAFDLITPGTTYVMPKTQGEGGINFIYTYAPAKGVADGKVTNLNTYYSTLMDNFGTMKYDPAGPTGFGGSFGTGWVADKTEHNRYTGMLGQIGGWFQPDYLDDGTVIRPGIRIDIPADGEYAVTWWIYNPNAGVTSTAFMVASDPPGAPAATPTPPPAGTNPPAATDTPPASGGDTPPASGGDTSPKTGDPLWLLAGAFLAVGASGAGIFVLARRRGKN
ncbi:MAG: hypothetical protein LBR85_06545 [Oscillospiraceae bacterium]|jgi:hypothetical protein|nr:hypothetical protein [Oscillospiraceae bacterium]